MDIREELPGGQINVSSNEINLMPKSTRDLFTKLISNFTGGQDCWIEGCEITFSATADPVVSPGYVFINGKLLRVEQHTILDWGTIPYDEFDPNIQFEETTVTDLNGVREFRDGNQKNVYLKERAIIRIVPVVTGLRHFPSFFTGEFTGQGLGGFMSTDLGGSFDTDGSIGTTITRPRNKPVDFFSLGVSHKYTQDFEVEIEFSTSHFSIPSGGIDLRVFWKFSGSNNYVITDYDNQNINSNNIITLPEPTATGFVQGYILYQKLSDGALRML